MIIASFKNGIYSYQCDGYHYETKILDNLQSIINIRYNLKRYIRIPLINKYIFF